MGWHIKYIVDFLYIFIYLCTYFMDQKFCRALQVSLHYYKKVA